jgi:Fe-S oxidoreductase
MFKDHLPEADVTSLWEVLDKIGVPESGINLPEAPLAVHDPCTTRGEPAVQEAVRRLLSMIGVTKEELILSREKTECCGFGGLMQNTNPGLAREVADRRGRHSQRDYLAYCAMCRDNLAAVGKQTVHLLDLLFPDPTVPKPEKRPRPGWSQRQENRSRLKADLCRNLWGEQPATEADHRKIVLRINPDVESVLESRRILEEDLQKVIQHAEGGGPKFCHPDTGYILAVFRPYHATFWVVYSPAGEGFTVHNAYAHCMEVLGP